MRERCAQVATKDAKKHFFLEQLLRVGCMGSEAGAKGKTMKLS